MHFDDRLATVLRQRPGGAVTARIQYRQLLDLLGTRQSEAQGAQIDAAYGRLAELSAAIGTGERRAILREPGMRLRSPRLIAMLCEGDQGVTAEAIDAAQLGQEQWLDLIPGLPVAGRSYLRRRRDLGSRVEALRDRLGIFDRGLPHHKAESEIEAAPMVAASQADVVTGAVPAGPQGIGAIVKRIEDFRKSRQLSEADLANGDTPRTPKGEFAAEHAQPHVSAFDFATDAAGHIVWSDPGMAPMAVGLRLAVRDAAGPVAPSSALVLALRRRQPVRAGTIEISGAPAIAGRWQVDAAPCFDPLGGRFTGYAGRMRRLAPPAEPVSPSPPASSESDRMRQLLHELRTPVNAIQGFAEVIQQQLFGPAPHEYRALAASIAADAARMLAGFEELERLARLDSGAAALEPGECDIAAAVQAAAVQLDQFTASRNSGFALELPDQPLLAAIAKGDAERLAWRLMATLAGAAAPGEILELRARARGGMARVTVRLPASLAARDGEALFHASPSGQPQALSASMFGLGFALRLAASEARAAGGSLESHGDTLRLEIPGLTAQAANHSHDGAAAESATGQHPGR